MKRTLFAPPNPSQPPDFRPPSSTPSPVPNAQDEGITFVYASAPPEGIQPTVWPVTEDGVRGALLEQMPLIRDCYDDALKEIPDLTGTMTVAFTIEPHEGIGQVKAADLLEDNLRDGPIEECVLLAVESLQFDPPADGGNAVVTWPFHFETREYPIGREP